MGHSARYQEGFNLHIRVYEEYRISKLRERSMPNTSTSQETQERSLSHHDTLDYKGELVPNKVTEDCTILIKEG